MHTNDKILYEGYRKKNITAPGISADGDRAGARKYADYTGTPQYAERAGARKYAANEKAPVHTAYAGTPLRTTRAGAPAEAHTPDSGNILHSVILVVTVFAITVIALAVMSYSGAEIPFITPFFNKLSDSGDTGGQSGSSGTGGGSPNAFSWGFNEDGSGAGGSNGANGSGGASDSNGARSTNGAGGSNGAGALNNGAATNAIGTSVTISGDAVTISGDATASGGADGQTSDVFDDMSRLPDLSLTYDPSEGTAFRLYGDYIAECSRNSFYLLGKDGSEAFRKNIDFTKPVLYKCGDYLLVSDYGGRSAFVMKGAKLVWENSFTSGIVYASINKNGYIALVLEAAGYRNSVRVLTPAGKTLFDWVIADDYVISSEIAPSGKEIVINRLKTAGFSASSGLEFLDMKSEPFRTVESGGDEVFLSARYLDNNALAVASESVFRLYSEQGDQLIYEKYDSIMAMCEFPKNTAAVAVRLNNRSFIIGYDAKTQNDRVLYETDLPVRNMSAENGLLFINLGGEAVVLRENGKPASNLTLDADVLYGGASEKTGVLAVNEKSADIYALLK